MIPETLAGAERDIPAIFDAIPVPTWILDLETLDFLAVNAAAISDYGYSRQEFLAMTIRKIVVPEDLPLLTVQLANLPIAFRRHGVLRHRRNDGSLLYVEPARQGMEFNGRRAVLSILNDVTDRIQAEELLAESEERSRLIVQTSLDAIIEINPSNVITGWNRQAETIFGWSREEAIGQRLTDTIIPERFHADHLRGLEQFARTGEGPMLNRRIEIMARRRNGEELPVELAITPICTGYPLGGGVSFCAFVRDITEVKRAEQEEVTRRFLTAASEVLASSLDYEQTLHRVADLAVPHIADWCGVDMLLEDGTISHLAVAHVDPEKVAWAKELNRLDPPNMSDADGLANVFRTGRPAVCMDVTDELLVSVARDPRHLELMRQLQARSVMTVPILAREQVLGTINLVTTAESGRSFTTEDLALAQALAARAALAIENARHYRAAQVELAERRRVQDALGASEQRFRFALADSDISVYMQDRELRYTWVYSGTRSEELTDLYGMTDADFLIPEDAATLTEIKQRVLEQGVECRYIVRATRHGQAPGFYDTVFAPLRDASGCIVGVTGTVNDITARKQAQDALAQQQAEISALNTRLQRSMSETHHRVKNNLQVISALLDMQEMQYEGAVPISEIARLGQHVKALSTIHDLLTHQAKNDAEVYDLSVKDAVEKLVPIIQGMVNARPIEFSVEDLRMPVRQSTSLTVLINELVSNAIKHGKGAIRLAFSTRDGKAMLAVSDEGPGFAADFDPVTAANTGLELIQTLAHLDLMGETRFENVEGGGGRVVVEFPIPSLTRSAGEQ